MEYCRSQSHTHARYGQRLLFDGPELQSNCHTLNETLQCFSDVADECYYYEDLYEYEQLLYGLTNVFTWMCKDIQTIRQHFLVLLQSLDCLERERINGKCSEPEIPPNVWTKILRLEVNSTICP
ncbi:hypothetical protein J437_LFUL006987 [Ladona fulva]|uniref:Uncharacterized protein n=1 Tax=Ladona fulva TaxID=123851 RepID=A0A8K0NZD2_LADFU|nr:hypothetical protein J437_LFUL006987 [Ladona fulva]